MDDFFWSIRRMCDIVLNNNFDNKALDSLALYVGHDSRVLNAAQPQETAEGQKTPTNTDSPKLPTLEECYKTIPFPEDERECAMFVAGIAECHKFICRQLRAGTPGRYTQFKKYFSNGE